MKKILISIKPKWVKKILNGDKTIEVRKTAPKCELPCEVYIYCTKENAKYFIDNKIYNAMMNGKVVANFTLNKVGIFDKKSFGTYEEPFTRNQTELLEKSCLAEKELDDYLKGKKGYAWHIDKLVPFDKPKELKEFHHEYKGNKHDDMVDYINFFKLNPLTHAPQSWQFVEVNE